MGGERGSMLSGVSGALGSLLAAIGMYGLQAYTVTRRINEIGIRMALGATQTAIPRMVLAEALGMTCGGLVTRILIRPITPLGETGSGPFLWRAAPETVLPPKRPPTRATPRTRTTLGPK